MTIVETHDCYLAIDTAYQSGMVVLFNKSEVLSFRSLEKKISHGKEICQTLVMKTEDFVLASKNTTIFTDLPEILSSSSIATTIEPLYGPTAQGIFIAACSVLRSPFVDQSAFIKPNYIKPPSVSLPKN